MNLFFKKNIKFISGLISLFLVFFGLFIQTKFDLEPCPLCITQRSIFLISGFLFLFFHFVQVKKIYYFFLLLSVNFAGLVFAIKHSLIQRKIIEIPSECGIDLNYMFENFPVQDVFQLVFQGSGDCSKVSWIFLNLTIPEWATIWFLVFIFFTIIDYKVK
jgi:disulfide bond formation protein DsbB